MSRQTGATPPRLGAVVAPWKEVSVDIHRHANGRVPEPFLDDLGRELQPAIGPPVDAPSIA
jgi:hypothetical protein